MTNAVSLRNAFTIDVEEWYQADGFARAVPRAHWAQLSSRAAGNLETLLQLLDERQTKATFFVQGSVADRQPSLVRRIAEGGHEIASRGYERRHVSELTPEEYRDDLLCAKALLEDLSGAEVAGYRAPAFSLSLLTPWAHQVMAECGYRYSSSLRPLWPFGSLAAQMPRFAHQLSCGLVEIPASSSYWLGRSWPGVGGGYFRLLPYTLVRRLVARTNTMDHSATVFHCCSWELDPENPQSSVGPWVTRVRHGYRVADNFARIESLLRDFEWTRMDRAFGYALGLSADVPADQSSDLHAENAAPGTQAAASEWSLA